MPRATCRCGQVLNVPVDGPERVICPKCSSRIRVRRDTPPPAGAESGAGAEGDGFIRFLCPCGRRLKVRADSSDDAPESGKCPDCGRVVPVPGSSSSDSALKPSRASDPESPTVELDADDLAFLDRWTSKHLGVPEPAPAPAAPAAAPPDPGLLPTLVSSVKTEAGLRICPRCGRPLHLSAVACRNCGAPAPKR